MVDGTWNLLIANTAAALLTSVLVPTDTALTLGGNVLRLFLHPDGARNSVANWPRAAAVLLDRLAAERDVNPTDTALQDLHAEVTAYPGVSDLDANLAYPTTGGFLTEIHIRTGELDLRLYTAISSFAAAADITLEELRLETLLPADPETADALRRLRSSHS